MLTQLTIQNYALVEELNLEFYDGMTVITGETGAGKSIMLDALGLALGKRVDCKALRPGAERAEIHACFDISELPGAKFWLADRDLLTEDECLLRRTFTAEGRSRAYINNQPCTTQDLKSLGALLINIHSQHEHQSLLDRNSHNQLLDGFGGHQANVIKLQDAHSAWQKVDKTLRNLQSSNEQMRAQQQLLNYQVKELNELDLSQNELTELETDQQSLENADQILRAGHEARDLCETEDGGLIPQLNRASQALSQLPANHPQVESALQLLKSAEIQIEEAQHEIQSYLDSVEINPERLHEVESRLTAIYDMSRKHQTTPESLYDKHQELAEELNALQGSDKQVENLTEERHALEESYQHIAEKLSKTRRSTAKRFIRQVQQQLKALSMTHCQFDIAFHENNQSSPSNSGNEQIELLISTNPGSEPSSLHAIASGGELSRISLAVQVVTAATSSTPTLVFDEVDVGIGGAIGEVVGNLLKGLADHAQVICVTHLAQVAAKGQQHLTVSKKTSKTRATTRLSMLDDNQKIEEIARMLGGIAITEQSLAHAEAMLSGPH